MLAVNHSFILQLNCSSVLSSLIINTEGKLRSFSIVFCDSESGKNVFQILTDSFVPRPLKGGVMSSTLPNKISGFAFDTGSSIICEIQQHPR